ncbi:hypothetical protein WEI85_17695 [Actinomycetes bacterium KLBMP 9797]
MRRLVALALAAGLLLAGCTDSSPTPPPPSASASAPPVADGGPPVAEGGTPFGAHWDPSRYQQFEPYLRKLAGSATYYELVWCNVERQQGQRNWSGVDRFAQRARELGITVHIKIRVGLCWATGGTAQHTRGQANKTESAMPRDLATYKSFVDAVVRRYAPYGVREYAVENEVNAPSYWVGSADDYLRLVDAAAAAVRAADPNAAVVDSGISSVGYGMGIADRLLRAGQEQQAVQAYQRYFERRIGTRGQQIPAVSSATDLRAVLAQPRNAHHLRFLAATEDLLDRKVVNVRQVHFYEPWGSVPDLLAYLSAETPAGIPIEAWEVGQFWRPADAAAADTAARAGEMVKTVTQLAAAGVRQIMWLPLAYNANREGGEERYGLLEPDGRERVTGQMLANLAAASRDATAQPVNDKGLRGVAFRRGGESTLVVWSDGPVVTVPGTSGFSAGPVESAPAPSDGVRVGTNPVLLKAPRPPADILGAD